MKKISRLVMALFIFSCALYSGCCCDCTSIREDDAQFNAMKDGILMVTKKRCSKVPATFADLVRCVENESTPGEGYGSICLTEFAGINNSNTLKGSGRDIAFYFDFYFKAGEAGSWTFEFGLDAGIASGCRVDNTELWFQGKDIWTLDDYSLAFRKDVQLSKGWHRMRIYGIENCCDGVWRLRFKSPSMKDFKTVSVKNIGAKCPLKI